jgi:polysaccharide biosynthesis protein PslG
MTLMPTIIDAPTWDALKHTTGGFVSIPRSTGPYASFVAALVQRYGPNGTFWQSTTPKMPVRMWQIWNEPNLKPFWPQQPWAQRYVALLKAAHDAIKRVDPGAKVILAGLPNYSWTSLRRIYAIRGARRLFDVVAVHPYTKRPQGVITILSFVRQVMSRAGDPRKPIVADEVSWPSSLGKTVHTNGYDFATTEAGQARNISQLLPMLAKRRTSLHLMGFYWYAWDSTEQRNGSPFDFSGLLKYTPANFQFTPKPALQAFTNAALAIEGCQPNLTVC